MAFSGFQVARKLDANNQAIAEKNFGVWSPIQTISVEGAPKETLVFNNIPQGATYAKIEGLLVADPDDGTFWGVQVNGHTDAVYGWTKHDFVDNGSSFGDNAADTQLPVSSAWSPEEKATIDIALDLAKPKSFGALDGLAFKSQTHNNGGHGDMHLTGGNIHINEAVHSIEFVRTVFAGGYAEGSILLLSVM